MITAELSHCNRNFMDSKACNIYNLSLTGKGCQPWSRAPHILAYQCCLGQFSELFHCIPTQPTTCLVLSPHECQTFLWWLKGSKFDSANREGHLPFLLLLLPPCVCTVALTQEPRPRILTCHSQQEVKPYLSQLGENWVCLSISGTALVC